MATIHSVDVSSTVLPESDSNHLSQEVDTPPNSERSKIHRTVRTRRSTLAEKNMMTQSIPEENVMVKGSTESPSRKVKRDARFSNCGITKDSIERPSGSTLSDSAWEHGLAIVFDYNIDPYDHSDDVLMDCTIIMFHAYDIFRTCKFTETTLRVFMEQVQKFYNPENLFHNFKHVWSVMHMSFAILRFGGDEYLETVDIFAVLVSALCHDLHHPGNNNAFEVATDSELSKLYSFSDETCVLEHHHAQSTHKLLISDEQELCHGLSRLQKEQFFKLVEFIILGTDMEKHSKLVAEAVSYTAEIEQSGCGESRKKSRHGCSSSSRTTKMSEMSTDQADDFVSKSNGSAMPEKVERSISGGSLSHHLSIHGPVERHNTLSRMSFARVLVHAADIGAQTQSKEVAYRWMQRCYGEFRSQANKERGLGIMTSPFLHDLQEDYKTFSSQYTFIAGIVEPLWTAMAKFLPQLQFAVDQLVENKLGYKKMLEDYQSSNKEQERVRATGSS